MVRNFPRKTIFQLLDRFLGIVREGGRREVERIIQSRHDRQIGGVTERVERCSETPEVVPGITYLLTEADSAIDLVVNADILKVVFVPARTQAGSIDVAEISGEYTYQELMYMEGLGFCERGDGGKLLDSGKTELGGELPVNPSGGVLPGNPNGVAGAARVAEAVLQLRGEAGERQVDGAKVALAHGITGICGQHQCVMILGNE